ncbi:MAG: hypothetical protein AB7F98_17120 [Novosphingobium sp.]
MKDTPTVSAVRSFLALIGEREPPTNERLAEALDELAMAYHSSPEGEPAEDDLDPPDWNFKARYSALAERFPQFGFYAVADPAEAIDNKVMCGDAIDDLADIEKDLSEIVWRSENLGTDDAHWHFKLLYRCHWGRHLRELALYLHANTW